MINYALQVYSIRDIADNDADKAFEMTSKAGYDGVELYSSFYNTPKEELKAKLEKYGLKCVSIHTDLGYLRDGFDFTVEYNKFLGNTHIVIPHAGCESEEEWTELAKELALIGERLNAAGMKFSFHNHDGEFKTIKTKTPMQILLENTAESEMGLEVDCYWVEFSGYGLMKFLNENSHRVNLLHIKDMSAARKMTEVGTGIIDYKAVKEYAKANNIEWLFVEQDEILMENKFESIKISLDNIKKM